MTTDTHGRPWATVAQVVEGSMLELDGSFTCASEGMKVLIQQDKHGLYFHCEKGEHYLDCHVESDEKEGEFYVGLYFIQ